ncbi:MAG TPA: amidohydrolase family protein [Xanthobacteraceae bacterium]|jgi:cytosine/adenosine deaminase-related metal-dependent hydrolase|nr:amidohydrolase family protein [Xanthobacteraceae bacterium]
MRTLNCAHLIEAADKPVGANRQVRIDGEHIVAVTDIAAAEAERVFVMPALVNAHDHGRAVRTSSLGAAGKPLETWIQYQALIPSVDPYLTAIVALSRTALGGVGTVMMHLTRPQGLTDLPTEAAAIARAARDIGIRVGFAIAMRDRNPLVYGPSESVLASLPPQARQIFESMVSRPALQPKDFITLCDEVAAAATGPLFDVQFGPNGVQWCSDALLTAIAEASTRSGRRIHMHLLETRYQRAWADAAHPGGVVKHLDALGLLSPRLTLAHCVWARPDELELLAARGVTIAVNTSSNLHLRSGIAPLAQMLKAGCRVAFGLDGGALDDDDDALRELRLLHLLHVGKGFAVEVNREQLLRAAFGNGRFSVTNKSEDGAILPGNPADLLVLDWDAIDNDRLRDDIEPLQLVLTRATARHIRELIVGGRTIVKDAKIVDVDAEAARTEWIARVRSGMGNKVSIAAALPALEQSIARHYEPSPGCF